MNSTDSKNEKGLRARLSRIRTIQDRFPFPLVAGLLVLVILIEIIFCILMISLGILPGQYVALVIVILLAIDVGIFFLVTNRKRSRGRFYTGLIVAVVMMILLLPMAYFLNTTGEAIQKLVAQHDQFEEYEVITSSDSAYEDVSDIHGKTVYVLGVDDKMNVEAREKLVTKADVELNDSEKDITALGNRIYNEQTKKASDDLILVSESQYELLCDGIDGFKKNSKIIYTEKIMKRADTGSDAVNVTKDPFNIYITGIDAWGSIDKVSRSDVNMIVTVNPQTRTILLTSIPRDAYVPLHTYGEYDKLTHTGIYGVEETLSTVEDWLDIDLNYYVKVNFSMVVGLVNAIDGITLYNEEEFQSSIAPYWYKKGWITMHGKKTLYYARERKWFEGGDARRTTHQQKVMEAIIKKVSSSEVILTHYTDILAVVSENMTMNLTDRELKALARMQLSDMDTKWTIKMANVKCEEAERGTFSMGMGRMLFVNIPKEESVEKVKEKIHNVMYPAETEETDDVTDLLQGN